MAAGPVDVLINNAALVRPSPVVHTDVRVWEEHLKVNLTGAFLCALKVLPGMLARGRGRIINIAGVSGLGGFSQMAAFAASKHGLIGFTRSLAEEVKDNGVTVNAICPGYVDSPMSLTIAAGIAERSGEDEGRVLESLLSDISQDKLHTPAEIAEVAAHLASEEAGDINGQAIRLDETLVLAGA